MKELTDYERGYLEAIIDGEGSIYISIDYRNREHRIKRGYTVTIRCIISNNDINLLNKVKNIIGSGNVVKKHGSGIYKNNINYEVRFNHDVQRWLLPQLNLIVKKERQKLAIQLLETLKYKNQYNNSYKNEKLIHTLVCKWMDMRNKKLAKTKKPIFIYK